MVEVGFKVEVMCEACRSALKAQASFISSTLVVVPEPCPKCLTTAVFEAQAGKKVTNG
jgi:hypothetical protein